MLNSLTQQCRPLLLSKSLVPKRSFHKEFNSSLEDQKFVLPSTSKNIARTISFAEYGSRDESATPAFFFHGAPGCRYDGLGYHAAARSLNVRIICPDRPGHGHSSHYQDRNLLDYPSDISQLARHLKLGKYHVFGQSGGGPYAVACAFGSPFEELCNATVVAGIGPPDSVTVRNAGLYTVCALWLHMHTPGLLKRLMEWYYPPSFLNNNAKLQRHLNWAYKLLPAEDRKLMEEPEVQPAIRAVLREALRQGVDGIIRDGQIYASQDLWGFELKDVKRKVGLVYGTKDSRTPLAFGKAYEKGLRATGSNLVIYEGMSHFNMSDSILEDILRSVVGKNIESTEAKDGARDSSVGGEKK